MPEYKIGDWVEFEWDYAKLRDGKNITYGRSRHWAHRRCGQIVGMTRRYEGTLDFGYSGSDIDGYPDDVPTEFRPTRSMTFWLVRLGLLNRALMVLDADLQRAVGDLDGVPLFHAHQHPWTKADRESLRQEIQAQPRDAKGRWVKWTPERTQANA